MVPVHAALAFLILMPCGILPLQAAPVSENEMTRYEKGFNALQESTRTFRADLRQSLMLEGMAKPIVSTGTLFYQTPDHLLLRFSKPAGEWLIINGHQMGVKKQEKSLDLQQVSSQGRRSHAASLLDFFSSGVSRWHKDFDVSMTREGDRLSVQLKPWQTPTSASQGVECIVTTLQLPTYDVLEIEVTINGENKISYQFSNTQRNIEMPSSLFILPSKP
jgi:outer membrane lipoprotein-sorting protein